MKNLIVGSLLHDFYLYDWHNGRIRKDGIHAWTHPIKALNNAERYFKLNKIQKKYDTLSYVSIMFISSTKIY